MTMRVAALRRRRFLLASAIALALAGCESALAPYRGDRPAEEDLVREMVIVRYVEAPVQDRLSFIVDRTRFMEAGDPHNVDRVISILSTDATTANAAALNLQSGDTIMISTEYAGRREVAELKEVPNWPGHRYYEYPIGAHLLTAVMPVP